MLDDLHLASDLVRQSVSEDVVLNPPLVSEAATFLGSQVSPLWRDIHKAQVLIWVKLSQSSRFFMSPVCPDSGSL
jgi:hypothetical protein